MSSEPEAGSRDAGHVALIGAVGVAAIFYQAGGGIGLVPEELKASSFNSFEEFIFVASETVLCRVIFKQWGPLGRRLRLRALRLLLRRTLRALQEFGN